MNENYNDLDNAINDAIFEKEINHKITYKEISFLNISNENILFFHYPYMFRNYQDFFLKKLFIYLYFKKKVHYIIIINNYDDFSGYLKKYDLYKINSETGNITIIKRNINNINNINSIIRTYKLKEIDDE